MKLLGWKAIPSKKAYFWHGRFSFQCLTDEQAIIGLPAKCETPLKWRFAGRPTMAHIECWLYSFVIFRRSRPVVLENPIFLWFSGTTTQWRRWGSNRRPSVLSQALYHCAPFLTLGVRLGAPGYPGGQNYFFQHCHVTYQIDGDNK